MKNPPVRQPELVSACRSIVKPGEYMILPANDRIVSSIRNLPDVGVQVMASPELGAAFVQYELLVPPGTGTVKPVLDGLQHFLFVLEGEADLEMLGQRQSMGVGGYAWLPPGEPFGFRNNSSALCRLTWIRRSFQGADDMPCPAAFVSREQAVPAVSHPVCDVQYLLPLENLAFDMAVNIQTFAPGNYFTAAETHVMEHGLYMLEGAGIYWLNGDYIEVKAGDFIYMAAYCPQAYFVTGHDRARYLIYKDWNLEYTEYL